MTLTHVKANYRSKQLVHETKTYIYTHLKKKNKNRKSVMINAMTVRGQDARHLCSFQSLDYLQSLTGLSNITHMIDTDSSSPFNIILIHILSIVC